MIQHFEEQLKAAGSARPVYVFYLLDLVGEEYTQNAIRINKATVDQDNTITDEYLSKLEFVRMSGIFPKFKERK